MNADAIIAEIIEREGSAFTDIPQDRGGPTKFGITLTTLRHVRPLAEISDLQQLSEQDAVSIYRAIYVAPFVSYQEPFLGLIVDSAVQHGVSRVKVWLIAANTYPLLLARRILFYGDIVIADQSQLKFLHGWLNRVTAFII